MNVALFVYRRPAHARRVLQSIRSARPNRLFLVCDGPANPSEREACQASQEVINEIDWPCEVNKIVSSEHLGCARRVSSGVSIVLDHVDSCIFLEDDCVADISFFSFCTALLDDYVDVNDIMGITGFNLLGRWKHDGQSYCFSRFGSSWGWATWRRAWKHFDLDITAWRSSAVKDDIRKIIGEPATFEERARLFDEVCSGRLDSWAVPWSFVTLRRNGMFAVPSINLVANIGFGDGATHWKDTNPVHSAVPVGELFFPLVPPLSRSVDEEYDYNWNLRAISK